MNELYFCFCFFFFYFVSVAHLAYSLLKCLSNLNLSEQSLLIIIYSNKSIQTTMQVILIAQQNRILNRIKIEKCENRKNNMIKLKVFKLDCFVLERISDINLEYDVLLRYAAN